MPRQGGIRLRQLQTGRVPAWAPPIALSWFSHLPRTTDCRLRDPLLRQAKLALGTEHPMLPAPRRFVDALSHRRSSKHHDWRLSVLSLHQSRRAACILRRRRCGATTINVPRKTRHFLQWRNAGDRSVWRNASPTITVHRKVLLSWST